MEWKTRSLEFNSDERFKLPDGDGQWRFTGKHPPDIQIRGEYKGTYILNHHGFYTCEDSQLELKINDKGILQARLKGVDKVGTTKKEE